MYYLNFFKRLLSSLIIGGQAINFIFKGKISRNDLFDQLMESGPGSLLIVLITGIAAGTVFNIQVASQLTSMGVSSEIGGLLAVGMAREMAPLLTATLMTGKVATAYAAQLGTMKVTEQIDALVTLSTNPMKYLTVPRVVAATLAVPLLVAVGDAIGIMGGYLVGISRLGFNEAAYIKNTVDFLEHWDILSGMIKGAVFGFIVSLMGCYYGMNSGRGAQGVGAATKSAVVAASVLILAANYVLTEVFFSA